MRPRNQATATTLHNCSILITGGFTGSVRLSSSEVLTASTWSPALELPSARSGHCMLTLTTTGDVFLHGGRTNSGSARDTYLSSDLTSWQPRASSEIDREFHACTEVTIDTEQEVWVGSASTTEIYSVATKTWREGPNLPNRQWYSNEFTSYNGHVYFADGSSSSRDIYQLKTGWTREDGWEKVNGILTPDTMLILCL